MDSTATACPRGPLAKFYGQYPPVCDKEFSVTVIKYISSVSVGMGTKESSRKSIYKIYSVQMSVRILDAHFK